MWLWCCGVVVQVNDVGFAIFLSSLIFGGVLHIVQSLSFFARVRILQIHSLVGQYVQWDNITESDNGLHDLHTSVVTVDPRFTRRMSVDHDS